ncbi:MAG: hypothetical protein GY769_17630 [bacterium]|nr:hypothetical protein [bacterium]
MATESVAVEIKSWMLPTVQKKVDALNRRADKLGLPRVRVDASKPGVLHHSIDCGCCGGLRSEEVVLVTAVGENVRVDGWDLVGVLDHGVGDKPVLRVAPERILPPEYYEAGPNCDHCGTSRRRRDTFVLARHLETGERVEYRQIGRTCLGDYLGENTAQAIVARAAWLGSLNGVLERAEKPDPDSPRQREEWRYDLEGFLAFTARDIAEFGWTSRTEAKDRVDKTATADSVLSAIASTEMRKKAARGITEEMLVEAKHAVEWAASVTVPEGNDYLHNVRVIAEAGWTNWRNAGYAASILTAYRRQLDRLAEREAERSGSNGEHFGEIGKRARSVAVRVLSLREIDGHYGPTTITKMRTPEGHDLTWFASGCRYELPFGNEPGGEFVVDMTVKDHGQHEGRPETRVNRVRVVA